MSDWTAGYTAEIDYTHGYYGELNPQRLQFAFAYNGLAFPKIGTACELGFGQGMSVNLHAAASVVKWWGTDFNPSQTAFAQDMAQAAGSEAQLYDEAFAEFSSRTDLPEFDYICLHGIFSWISDENRQTIVDFVRRKLKAGGVLYISYNTLPGWSDFAPMRELMSVYAEAQGSRGEGVLARADKALDFADRLLKTQPAFARNLPAVTERLAGLKGQNRNYLAHEYFNRNWEPMYFSQMAHWLEETKLQFACSANFLDYVPKVNLTVDQANLLAEVRDPVLVQTMRDFMLNQRFRKEYWVKGLRSLPALERLDILRQQRIILLVSRNEVRTKFATPLGESSLMDSVVLPLLDQLADHQIKSLGELEQAIVKADVNFEQVLQAVVVLLHTGQLELMQSAATVTESKKKADKLNAYLMRKARDSGELTYLAAPGTGGAAIVGRFQQLFLLSRAEGSTHPKEWAQYVWEILQQQGQVLIKDGKTMDTVEENLAELVSQATDFAEKRLPVMQALQLA